MSQTRPFAISLCKKIPPRRPPLALASMRHAGAGFGILDATMSI
jgi:hypothetical protein